MTVVNAAIGIGGAIWGSRQSKKASDSANATSQAGTDAVVGENARQYNQTRDDYKYLRDMGEAAGGRMEDMMAGDMSSFQTSPGYNFRKEEGNRAMNNQYSNASGGGNAMRELVGYNQNFASNEFGNFWNRNAGMAGAGQAAVGGTAMAGANAANNNSSAYMANASNQGTVGLWGAKQQNNMMQGGMSNALYAYEDRNTEDEKWWT